jgi:hypothetical protein
MTEAPGRKAVNAHTTPFLPFDMEGPVQPDRSRANPSRRSHDGVEPDQPCPSRPGSALKAQTAGADSEIDSRLGTDGNQPGLERREGAADDAALLIAREPR